jgi:hypothetical protein
MLIPGQSMGIAVELSELTWKKVGNDFEMPCEMNKLNIKKIIIPK